MLELFVIIILFLIVCCFLDSSVTKVLCAVLCSSEWWLVNLGPVDGMQQMRQGRAATHQDVYKPLPTPRWTSVSGRTRTKRCLQQYM